LLTPLAPVLNPKIDRIFLPLTLLAKLSAVQGYAICGAFLLLAAYGIILGFRD
jgi:hypothetical protein